MTYAAGFDFNGSFGSLTAIPVIESPHAPPGVSHVSGPCGQRFIVRNRWTDLELPVIIRDMRKAMRQHLADLVAAAEQRLGLDRP